MVLVLAVILGGAELGVIYFRTIWGAKEPQNLTNHGVVVIVFETKKKPQEKLYTPNSLATGSPENHGFPSSKSPFPLAEFSGKPC